MAGLTGIIGRYVTFDRTSVDYVLFLTSLVAYFLFLYFESFNYRPRSRLFPTIVVIIFVTSCIIELFGKLLPEKYIPKHESILDEYMDEAIVEDQTDVMGLVIYKKRLKVISWLLLFIGIIVAVGFIPAIALFLFVFQVYYAGEEYSYAKAALFSVVALAMIYIIFVVLLGTPFYEGAIFGGIAEAIPD